MYAALTNDRYFHLFHFPDVKVIAVVFSRNLFKFNGGKFSSMEGYLMSAVGECSSKYWAVI